jgi:dihydroorotate dehydrogenase (NAD+) catalytic subunit
MARYLISGGRRSGSAIDPVTLYAIAARYPIVGFLDNPDPEMLSEVGCVKRTNRLATPGIGAFLVRDVPPLVNLQVQLGRLTLKNPVLVASGTFGYVREMAPFVRLERLGGVIPKTVTFRARAGNATPRTVETASGLLNAIGLDNDGIDHFRAHHLPYLRTVGTAVIANIAGEDIDQFVSMAAMLAGEPGLAALELNVSCPNVSHGLDLGIDAGAVGRLVRRVREACPDLPLIAKLTPNVTDIAAIAAAAAEAGADALSLVNTFRGMAVDWRARRPILANDVGGLSGPAIKPLALRMVWDVARACPGVPLIGIGGIAEADDALEFLVAGARAVQVGTATFYDPTAAERLLDDLTERLAAAGIADVNDLIGTLRSNQDPHPSRRPSCPAPPAPRAC